MTVATDARSVGRGLVWAGVGLLIFSGWFAVTRLVVTGDLQVWDVVALRLGGGTLVLLPVLLIRCRVLPWAAWQAGFVLSMLWGAPFVLLVAAGLQLTSAAHAASMTPGLMPVFAGGMAWFLSGVRPPGQRLAGYGMIVMGLVGLVAVGAAGTAGPAGLACLVLAAAGWAAYTVRLGRSGLDPLQAAAMVCLWSALLYLPPYVLSGVSHLPDASLNELAFQGFYQGALMSGLAIYAFNRAVALLGAIAAAAIIALVPVVGALLAVAVVGEAPPLAGWLAIAVVAAGVALAAAPARRATPSDDSANAPALSPQAGQEPT